MGLYRQSDNPESQSDLPLQIQKLVALHPCIRDDDKTYEVILKEVIHAPDMDSNLISTTALLNKELEVSMHPVKDANILKNGEVIARTVPRGRL